MTCLHLGQGPCLPEYLSLTVKRARQLGQVTGIGIAFGGRAGVWKSTACIVQSLSRVGIREGKGYDIGTDYLNRPDPMFAINGNRLARRVMPEKTLPKPSFHVVLFQPEIPQNTGNIGRSCVALDAKLWIVRPTGFRLDATQLQRAGLDYWQHLDWEVVDSWEVLRRRMPIERTWFFTKFATQLHTEVRFEPGDWLVFGAESTGLPESIRTENHDRCVRLPMTGPVRSLNLAVSAGVGLYEAFRQCTS